MLEAIEGAARTAAFLFDAFTSDYGTSYRKLRYGPPLVSRQRSASAEAARVRHNYQAFLSGLKRDGFIDAASPRGEMFRITRGGKGQLARLRERWRRRLPVARYEPEEAAESTIIVFDIPERARKKRDWLRVALKQLQFQMLQKSVWFGKKQLPRTFLEDLRACQLLPHVEIFSITKRGTLRRRIGGNGER